MQLAKDHSREVFVPSNLLQIWAIHLVTLGIAPFVYRPQTWVFGAIVTIVCGYCMGIFHHMLLTHRSFRTPKWVEYVGALFGTLSWRGPFAAPIRYVAMHRVHHAYADTELDPHSPTRGIFYAFMGWFWRMPYGFTDPEIYDAYAGDIAKDPFLRFLDRHVNLVQLMWGVVCFGLGMVLSPRAPDLMNGVRFVVAGVFVKSFVLIYLANAVDVLNHFDHPGSYRGYATEDRSTNSMLMLWVHWGGVVSWHNNHHAHPAYFTVKKRAWEVDFHYFILRCLSVFGLASDIHVLDESRPAVTTTRSPK